jgi:hypothetical protein
MVLVVEGHFGEELLQEEIWLHRTQTDELDRESEAWKRDLPSLHNHLGGLFE